MASNKHLKNRTRQDYPFLLEYRTRWSDNDMYDHMNNSVYNVLSHPLMAHTHTDYFAAISYPKVAELCLRVNKLSKSSVVYEAALFEKGVEHVKAVGEFVHVFVDRATQRPNVNGMNTQLRQGLEKLLVGGDSSKL
ncbi:HotDog domain-containing protein [Xylariomycetidae sp. FL2044]|nr:HotDog domain-containing protein [Xylariomycetidae sp. FL2044]